MTTKYRKKLIEVALPLAAINEAAAREKSIRHGHPSTLHLWWARRPLAAARAILFAQLVDDPSAWPDLFPTEGAQEKERQRLFAIIEKMVPWEATNNEAIINSARLEIAWSWARSHPSEKASRILAGAAPEVVNDYLATELPPVHDPFAGGGTIPLEAQRLGLRAIATDLNPVAVLINKGLIEFPPKFAGKPPVNPVSRQKAGLRTWKGAEGLAEDVRYYGAWMREEARNRIGQLYPDVEITEELAKGRPDLKALVGQKIKVIAWLWARTVASPNPAVGGLPVPLVSNFWLSTKEGKKTWVEPVVEADGRSYRFTIRTGVPADAERISVGTRAGKAQDFVCLLSGEPVAREYVREEGKAGRLGERLMARVATAKGHSGRIYLPPAEAERELLRSLDGDSRARTARETFLNGSLPSRAMITGGVCSAYGLSTWGRLFTDRQLVALTTLSDLVAEAQQAAQAQAVSVGLAPESATLYSQAIATYLAFTVSRFANYSSTLCVWSSHPKDELTKQVFMRQALPMTWDFSESNPFAESGGTLSSSLEFTSRSIEAITSTAPGAASQLDASTADFTGALVATDPPYFDNISYAELSDFFYVWLRRSLYSVTPGPFATVLTPKANELIVAPARHEGDHKKAEEFFRSGIQAVMGRVAHLADHDAPATVFYAFKQSETDISGTSSTGWEVFLQAVHDAGLSVVGTWPIRTELVAALKKNVGALASSVVLVCRQSREDASSITRGDFRRALREELPSALKALKHGNVAPVDVAQASIGPGMAIFSRHARVLEADGSAMTVRAALRVINEALDEYLTAQEGDADPDTRFAVTWFDSSGWNSGGYGDAETLAKARNVSVAGIAEASIIHSAAGRVRLLKRSELPADWDPTKDSRLTVWEATQHLIKRLEEQGEAAAAALLKALGPLADHARDLAYRLYSTCERKGWAEDARAYNGLVIAWPELEKLAAAAPTVAAPAGQLGLGIGDDVAGSPAKRGAKARKRKA